MRILDRYIMVKFLKSLILVVSIILPVGIAIDISEKIDKFIKHTDLTLWVIIRDYYQHFIITYGNQFLPLAIFIAVIWFTSKMAQNTEIIAIHSARISFHRLLFPYMLTAGMLAVFLLYMNHFVVPSSNAKFTWFNDYYIRNKKDKTLIRNISLQIGKGDYVYIRNYRLKDDTGSHFVYEHYDGEKLRYSLKASSIQWLKKDSVYRLKNYYKRYIRDGRDLIKTGRQMDTLFNFHPKDVQYIDHLAKEMTSPKLKEFIELSRNRGIKNLNPYVVELKKRTSLPFSAFILTIMAVSLSARKRRGGVGLNLALGFGLAFTYIFFMKIAEVMGAVTGANTTLWVWMPNIIFSIVAYFVYRQAAIR